MALHSKCVESAVVGIFLLCVLLFQAVCAFHFGPNFPACLLRYIGFTLLGFIHYWVHTLGHALLTRIAKDLASVLGVAGNAPTRSNTHFSNFRFKFDRPCWWGHLRPPNTQSSRRLQAGGLQSGSLQAGRLQSRGNRFRV